MATPSSLPVSLRKALPDLEAFLKAISKDEPAGPSLRYDSLYDDVRLCRQEDDPRLSMGIWKTDLKRADWNKVEDLCVEALVSKSKDLQIIAWLTEAWTALDGIEGYSRGIQLLSGLCETFWEAIHPQPGEDGDMENRSMIFEWLESTLSSRLLLIPLTRSKLDETSYGLGFYRSAQHGDAAKKRVDPNRNPSTNDPAKAIGSVEDFQKSLEKTPDDYITNQQSQIEIALQTTQTLKDTLLNLMGNASPSFSQIFATLKEMERLLKAALLNREPPPPEPASESTPEPLPEVSPEPSPEPTPEPTPEPSLESESSVSEEIEADAEPSPPEEPVSEVTPVETPPPAPTKDASQTNVDLTSREDAYRQLEVIASFLDANDPHSLAPQLIRQLIGWQNKNVVEIFGEIAKTPQEYEILMKILGSAPSKE